MLATVTLLFLVPVGLGQEQVVRVASYNIKFLSTAVTGQGDRRAKLQEVIDRLEADVIGLQEIKDRAALDLIFPSSQWEIVIDDDSGSDQDVAVVVRKPLRVIPTWMPTTSIFFFLGPLTTRFSRIDAICFS